MDLRKKTALGFVIILGLISAVVSFTGEALGRKVTVTDDASEVHRVEMCNRFFFRDMALAVVAAGTLLLAHLILRIETGQPFFGCGPPRPHVTIWFAIVSWLAGSLAILLLGFHLAIAFDCENILRGAFAVAGTFSLASTATGITYMLVMVSPGAASHDVKAALEMLVQRAVGA